jgi:hypothetical protein
MTHRRKFLAGVGALATGSAAAVGTGAFTSVSANRTMNVDIADDSNAFLGLEAGDSGLVVETGDTLQINLDGTGADGSGVNMDAVTTIGNHDNPQDSYAFKVTNQGTQALLFSMNYFFANTGWLQNNGTGQSHINFTVYGDGQSYSTDYPRQGPNRDRSLAQPSGGATGDAANRGNGYRFEPGDQYYVVISIDTTGANAATTDDLSGTAVLQPAVVTDQDLWYPDNPPSQ